MKRGRRLKTQKKRENGTEICSPPGDVRTHKYAHGVHRPTYSQGPYGVIIHTYANGGGLEFAKTQDAKMPRHSNYLAQSSASFPPSPHGMYVVCTY